MNIAELQDKVEKRFSEKKKGSAVIYQFPVKKIEKEVYRVKTEHLLMNNFPTRPRKRVFLEELLKD